MLLSPKALILRVQELWPRPSKRAMDKKAIGFLCQRVDQMGVHGYVACYRVLATVGSVSMDWG